MPHVRVRLAVLLLATVLAGCTGSATGPSPTPTLASSSATPTPTLSEGQLAANATVIKYRALIDQLRQQYKPDSTQLLALARDAAYDKWSRVLQDDFVNGWHQTGVATLSINATESGTTEREWLVSACLDVTKVDIVDNTGNTTLQHPGGINHIIYTVDQDVASSRWYVMNESFDGARC